MPAKKVERLGQPRLLKQLLSTADAHAVTEARQRQDVLRICSELLALDEDELWSGMLPEQVRDLRANLHNLLRRLETDAAVVTAVLAKISSGPDDDEMDLN
jgi:hypothetical protein